VTVSAGVCDLEAADGCGTALYRRADEALYAAKAFGRDMALAWRAPRAETGDGDGTDRWTRLQRDADEVDRLLGDRGHAAKVARMAVALAVALDWPAHLQAQLHRAALLHDVGKRPLLPGLLERRAPLTPAQRAHIQQHPRIGAAMAAEDLAAQPCDWIRHHHERWDGAGYPDGLRAEASPEGAQLLAIADAYEAMRGPRPYRDALAEDAALAEIDAGAGTQFRPDAGDLVRRALDWLAGA
jgi:HD-GYP domain-containing protein (c-di-GMP phosphodiesterase class II)